MKKIIFLQVLAFVWGICFLATMAAAQDAPISIPPLAVQSAKPALTSPFTIALTYYKLAARAPDFESWVKQKDSYKNANRFDQPAMMSAMVQQMKDAYNNLLLTEPLIVQTQVTLSPYDAKNQGFFVESFKSSTFFPASYAGESYAIVPEDITDKQWLKVDDPDVAAATEKAAAGNNHLLTMVIYLTPRYADTKSPAVIDGENYWPIAADVKQMMLYPAADSNTVLWQSTDANKLDKLHQSILNLYQ